LRHTPARTLSRHLSKSRLAQAPSAPYRTGTPIRFKGSSTKPPCSAEEYGRQDADTGYKRKLKTVHIPHTQAAFGLLGADSTESDAIHVLKWIRGQGLHEFTQREAQKALEGRFRTVEKLKKAIAKLIAMECIRQIQKKLPVGRPSTVFIVNPGVLS
jgi:hypothetical protein